MPTDSGNCIAESPHMLPLEDRILPESMALQLIRTARSVDDIAVFKSLMHLVMEVVEPLVASPIRFLFSWRRSVAGHKRFSAEATMMCDFADYKQRMFHQSTSLFKKRDSDSQSDNSSSSSNRYLNVATKIAQLRKSNGNADALSRCIGDRLTPDFVLEMIKSLRHDADTALFFFKWAAKQEAYEHDARIFNQVLRVLASASRLQEVDAVLEEMMRKGCSLEMEVATDLIVSYANAGMVDRAQEIFSELRQRGHSFAAHVYNSIFSALDKQQRYQDVYDMIGELLTTGFIPSESTSDVLIRIFCKGNSVDKAVWFLSFMSSKRLQVHAMAVSMVIDSLCKIGKEDLASILLEDTATRPGISLSDKYFLCCSLICGIFRTGELTKASQMIRKLAHSGLVGSDADCFLPGAAETFSYSEIIGMFRAMKVGLSTFEYNCFIEGLCKADKLDEAQQVYDVMRTNEIPADIFTYNYVIECISRDGRVEEAQKLLEAMETSECKPDIFTYTRIINGFCKLGKFDNALLLLGRMNDAGCSPDAVTFDCIINGLCKASNFGDALEVLKVSVDAGCEPDEVTYSSIIDPLCRLGDWESALEIFEAARRRNCPGSVELYSRLMKCLCKTGKVDAACQLLQDLINGERNSDYLLGASNCSPDLVLYSVVVDGLCSVGKISEAFLVVQAMEDRGIKPDIVTYTSFLHAFCSSGRLDDACKLLEMMVKAGCSPDVVAYNTLIASLCSLDRDEEACGLLEVMIDNGCEPDGFTFNRLIAALCRSKKVEAAMNLFGYMKLSRRCVPELSTYRELIYGHCRVGRVREARKLLEQESKAFSMSNPGKSLLSELHQTASFTERKQLSAMVD